MEVKRGLVMVIQEKDLMDNERIVLGVATNRDEALKMIKEYYGDDHIMSEFQDIRDDNLDFSCKIEVKGNWGGFYYVWSGDFNINSL